MKYQTLPKQAPDLPLATAHRLHNNMIHKLRIRKFSPKTLIEPVLYVSLKARAAEFCQEHAQEQKMLPSPKKCSKPGCRQGSHVISVKSEVPNTAACVLWLPKPLHLEPHRRELAGSKPQATKQRQTGDLPDNDDI